MVTSRGRVGLLLALWLALALRAASPGLVEFKYDEARAFLGGRTIAQGDGWPLTSGGTSWGIPRPALTLYLLALPAAIADDPRLAVLFLALLGTVAVAAVYRVGRALFDAPTARVAAFFVAVNPWAIHYDRKLWAHPLPLLGALAMLLAARLILQRKPAAVLPLLAVLALQGQTHTLGWVVAVAALGPVLLFRPRLAWRPLAVGLAAAFLITLPWLVGLGGARSGLAETVGRNTVGGDVTLDGWGVRFLLWLASGEGLAALLGEHAPQLQAWSRWLTALTVLAAVGIAGAVAVAVWRAARRQPGGAPLWFLVAWLALPLLAFSVRAAPIHLQYLTTLWPAPFLLIARPLALAWTRRLWPLAAALLLAVGIVQVGSTRALRDHLQQGEGTLAFGVPLARWQTVADAVQAEAQAMDESTVYVLADGSDPAISGQPAVLTALLRPLHLRFMGEGNAAAFVLPEGRAALYLLTVDAPLAAPLLAQWGDLAWTQPLGEGVPAAHLYRVRPVGRDEMAGVPVDVAFDNGLRLWRAAWPAEARSGDTLWLTTVWMVEAALPDAAAREWTTFAHLLDGAGERRGQFDGFGHPSRFWRAGDIVVQWHAVPVDAAAPAGDYTVLLGVYSRADGARAVTADGRDAVTLGPLRLVK